MSVWTERVAKPWPHDVIEPKNLPDTAPEEHPAPWRLEEEPENRINLYDANNVEDAHVSCWDYDDDEVLQEKLRKINGQ